MTICYLPRFQHAPAMFEALAYKHRREILNMIGTTNLTATDMALELGISQQTASRHVCVLQRAGLVSRLGWEVYAIDAGGIDELQHFIRTHFVPPDRYVRRPVWM